MTQSIRLNPLVQDFLERVCAQIRATSVHDDIRLEMLHHLEELILEKMEEGMTESKAIESAIARMGDPDMVGKQLNSAHMPKVEWGVIVLVICMMIVGGVTLFALYSALDGGAWIQRKISVALAGVAVMGVLYFVDYRKLLNFSSLLYASALLLMAVALWQGVAMNGAKQWISIGGFSINCGSGKW